MPMNAKIEIRVLKVGDEAILERADAEAFDDPIDPRAAAEFLADPRHHLAVAMDDGVVVGFVSAVHYVHPDKAHPEMFVNEVGVAPSHQRRGLARELMRAMLDTAGEVGCREAWVLTDRTNDAAMGLYSGAGGVEAESDQVMFTFHIEADR